MSRSLRDLTLAAAALATLALAGPVRADDRQDLHSAYRKMMALTRFKATMVDLSTGKTGMTMEYQAPDRYRITVPG